MNKRVLNAGARAWGGHFERKKKKGHAQLQRTRNVRAPANNSAQGGRGAALQPHTAGGRRGRARFARSKSGGQGKQKKKREKIVRGVWEYVKFTVDGGTPCPVRSLSLSRTQQEAAVGGWRGGGVHLWRGGGVRD